MTEGEQVAAGEGGASGRMQRRLRRSSCLAAYCARVHHLPPGPDAGKLISNYLVMGMIGVIATAIKARQAGGLGKPTTFSCWLDKSGALKKMVGPALKGDYDGYRFSMVNAEKACVPRTLAESSACCRRSHGDVQDVPGSKPSWRENVSRLLDPSIEEQP
jgi:hypothetical protein